MRIFLLLAVVAVLAALSSAVSSTQQSPAPIRLFIGYCPTDFSGAGAVVDVNPITGAWKIVSRVKLPSSEVFGCVADYDPTFDFAQSDPNELWFDFVSDDGFFLEVDMRGGNTTSVTSSDVFFTGFIDFKFFAATNTLNGVAGTVTQDGICSDGCLSYGIQQLGGAEGRHYKQVAIIPFKAGADDTSFVDWKRQTLAFQGSYDLRPQPCGPASSSQCLVTINTTNGALVSAVYTPSYQVFKFARRHDPDGSVLAFTLADGCNASTGAPWTYQFRNIDMATAASKATVCLDPNLVIDEDQWVADFSTGDRLFATASGNGNGDDPQLLVLNVTSGATVLNSKLSGLAEALGAKMGLIFVWALSFAPGEVPN